MFNWDKTLLVYFQYGIGSIAGIAILVCLGLAVRALWWRWQWKPRPSWWIQPMERGNSDGLSQRQPLLILSRIQNADNPATSLIALILLAFTLFPGTGSYWVWPRWHQAFSQQDLITLQSKAGVTHPRLLYLSLVVGAMGCIVPGPFALLHAHWSLQVEAVLKGIHVTRGRVGR